jgi:hypothetical protein
MGIRVGAKLEVMPIIVYQNAIYIYSVYTPIPKTGNYLSCQLNHHITSTVDMFRRSIKNRAFQQATAHQNHDGMSQPLESPLLLGFAVSQFVTRDINTTLSTCGEMT